MVKALEHVRILDLTQFLAGSYCTMVLAGLGAEVIKIERPGTGEPARLNPPYAGPKGIGVTRQSQEDISLSILKRCRNKRAVTLNLHSPKGKEIFLQLVANADVVVENFRPGTMLKMGLSYDVMAEVNPAIIYCSVSGFGQNGEYASLPAFDIVVQAMGGVMSTNGFPDGGPTKTGIAVGDLSGGLFACVGILAALEYQRKTGKGQEVNISMLESLLSFVLDEAPDYWVTQGQPLRSGNRLTRLTPFNAYRAKDGFFVIASGSNEHWLRILTAIGREDLSGDQRYQDLSERVKRADEVDALINLWADKVTVEEALSVLKINNVPCAPVREIPEVVSDEHLIAEGAIMPVTHPTCGVVPLVKAAGLPIHFSLTDAGFDSPAPMVGQNNAMVYGELLNLSNSELATLEEEGVI